MLRDLIKKHKWFIKSSPDYLGYDDYMKAKRKIYPLIRAYIRFMWFSRKDKGCLYA